jgi:hypothetical protein
MRSRLALLLVGVLASATTIASSSAAVLASGAAAPLPTSAVAIDVPTGAAAVTLAQPVGAASDSRPSAGSVRHGVTRLVPTSAKPEPASTRIPARVTTRTAGAPRTTRPTTAAVASTVTPANPPRALTSAAARTVQRQLANRAIDRDATPSSKLPRPIAVPGDGGSFGPTLVGAAMGTHPNETWADAVTRGDHLFGNLHALRVYHGGLPRSWSQLTALTGRRPLIVSFKANPRTIVAGTDDAFFRTWFADAPRDHLDYWSFYHEPENDIPAAFTAADYRAAWVHLRALSLQAHNPQLLSTLILMGWSLQKGSGRNWLDYYPGDAAIDVLGWDVYNSASRQGTAPGAPIPGTYTDPASLFANVIAVSKSHGKPWAIGEINSLLINGDKGPNRAAWLEKVGAYAKANGAAYLLLFDSNNGSPWELLDTVSQQAWRHVNTTS